MTLKTLTYTSEVRGVLEERELERIHLSARTLNALDGVTGLLIFNGRTFLQVVEGAADAIDDLAARLDADVRHGDIVIHEERVVDERSFPDWSMSLVRVSLGRFEARRDIEAALPSTVSPVVRDLLMRVSDLISS